LGSPPQWWLDGSAGTLVDAGAGVCSQWSDSSGAAIHFTFSGAARPLIIAGGRNGKDTLRFTPAQTGGNATFAAPAPGTTPSYFFAIAKPVTLPSPGVILGRGPGNNTYIAGADSLQDANPSPGPISTPLIANTWYRIEWLETNQPTDFVQTNGLPGGSINNAGNASSLGVYLNATAGGAANGNWEYAEIFQWFGVPTGAQRADLAAYALAKWLV